MPKTIPAALLAHKALPTTTLTTCLRIGPLSDDSYIALTRLDRDLTYDLGDGAGPLTYRARTGSDLSAFMASIDLSVDNAEAASLIEEPAFPNTGITQDMIDSSALSGVEFVVVELNYNDLTTGRHEIVASGTVGEVRLMPGGLITVELRGWQQLLKQNSVCEMDSLTCRVKQFGSQVGEERFPCKYDASGEWVTGVAVTAVGAESVREFTAAGLDGAGVASIAVTAGGSGYTTPPAVTLSGGGGTGATATAVLTGGAVTSVTVTSPGANYLTAPVVSFSGGGGTGATATATLGGATYPNDYFAPGLLTWTTGANAGTSREVDTFAVGGAIGLRFITRNPVQVGDVFSIRRDCTRQWAGHNSCQTYANRANFRGEPFIPISDTTSLAVPGAAAGGGFIGSGEAVA